MTLSSDHQISSPLQVQNFLEKLIPKLQINAKKHKDLLKNFKRKMTKNSSAEFESWDHSYYGMIYKNNTFKIDEKKIEEYFPLEHVKQNIMEI